MTSRKSVPTPEQIEGLKAFGIVPPPTHASCSAIFDWINRGGTERGNRVAIFKAAQAEWLGKRVRGTASYNADLTGTVAYLIPKIPGQLVARSDYTNRKYRNPLDARVITDAGKSKLFSLGLIELVVETSESS